MGADAENEAEEKLLNEGKKVTTYVRKSWKRWQKLTSEIMDQKIAKGVDPKHSENFAKYLKHLKEECEKNLEEMKKIHEEKVSKGVIQQANVNSDEDLDSGDSDSEYEGIETDEQHKEYFDRLRNEKGVPEKKILEMIRNRWRGIKNNKTN